MSVQLHVSLSVLQPEIRSLIHSMVSSSLHRRKSVLPPQKIVLNCPLLGTRLMIWPGDKQKKTVLLKSALCDRRDARARDGVKRDVAGPGTGEKFGDVAGMCEFGKKLVKLHPLARDLFSSRGILEPVLDPFLAVAVGL